MIDMSNEILDKFFDRIKQALRTKSKEIRFTLDESNELAVTIGQILNQQNSLLNQIIELQNQITINVSGGSFKKK